MTESADGAVVSQMFSRGQQTTKLMFSQSERGQKAFALDYCAASFVTEGEAPEALEGTSAGSGSSASIACCLQLELPLEVWQRTCCTRKVLTDCARVQVR